MFKIVRVTYLMSVTLLTVVQLRVMAPFILVFFQTILPKRQFIFQLIPFKYFLLHFDGLLNKMNFSTKTSFIAIPFNYQDCTTFYQNTSKPRTQTQKPQISDSLPVSRTPWDRIHNTSFSS